MGAEEVLLDFDYVPEAKPEKPFVSLYANYEFNSVVWNFVLFLQPLEYGAPDFKCIHKAEDAHNQWLIATGGRASKALGGAS